MQAGDQLQSGTTLQLLPGIHRLGSGQFCQIHNLANLTIRGQTSPRTEGTVIWCDSDALGHGIALGHCKTWTLDWISCQDRQPPSLQKQA